MDGYRTQSPDTTREAEQVLFQYYATLKPWQKIQIIEDLNRTAEGAAVVGIRKRYPDADEREVRIRLAALKYGRELTVKFLGWDPNVEGW
jgi:hypothetical protein